MVYLNEVENTTVYRKRSDPNFPIAGDQITAIYLSPKDPNYFQAQGRPVALYRYQLSFSPLIEAASEPRGGPSVEGRSLETP